VGTSDPDLQPTVDQMVIEETYPSDSQFLQETEVIGEAPVISIEPPAIAPVPQGLPDPLQLPQSRFTPIDDPGQVKQTSFPTETSSLMTERAPWVGKPWKKTETTNQKRNGPRPARLGGKSEMLTSE